MLHVVRKIKGIFHLNKIKNSLSPWNLYQEVQICFVFTWLSCFGFVVSWNKKDRHTCKIRDILFRRKYGTPVYVNKLSCICFQTQSRTSSALNSPHISPACGRFQPLHNRFAFPFCFFLGFFFFYFISFFLCCFLFCCFVFVFFIIAFFSGGYKWGVLFCFSFI